MVQFAQPFKVQLEFSEIWNSNSRKGPVTLWNFEKTASRA